MTWAHTLQEIRIMRFKRVYTGWKTRTMTQDQAAEILGVSARTFRRYIYKYDEDGLAHLFDFSQKPGQKLGFFED